MTFTKFFVGSVAILCCSSDFGIYATSFDSDNRQGEFYDNYMNLVWNCDSNTDCTTPESSCVDKKCQCSPNFIFNAAMTSCLKAAEKYGDTCEETIQCTAYLLSGGNCTDGVCSCATGYHYLHGRCNKSSGLKEKCRKNDDCYVNADYEALTCTNEACRCSDGFYQREYRTCRREAKEIGAECMIDLDCTFDKNARCDKTSGCLIESKGNESNTFHVPENPAARTLGLAGVKSNVLVGIGCTNDKECEHLGAGTCDAAGRCICKRGYFLDAKMTHCVPELGEKCVSTDVVSIKNSICRDGQWNCNGATVPAINKRKCLKVTRAYNNSCTQDEQCYIFGPDASCVGKKRCLCNENSHYSEENMFCWVNKGVGDSCERDLDCYVKGFDSVLTCTDKSICACSPGTHINAAGTACIDDIAAIGGPCTADEDCKPLKNAMCQNDYCSCVDNYFDSLGECVSGINTQCKDDDDCKPKHSICLAERCSCAEGFVSPSAGLCVKDSFFGGFCQYDVQCSTTATNAFCSLLEFPEADESAISEAIPPFGICSCDTDHHYKYGRCYRKKVLQEPCNSRGECYVESEPDSTVCLKGLCHCGWKATQINATFCKSVASSEIVLSSSIGLTIAILRFVGIL